MNIYYYGRAKNFKSNSTCKKFIPNTVSFKSSSELKKYILPNLIYIAILPFVTRGDSRQAFYMWRQENFFRRRKKCPNFYINSVSKQSVARIVLQNFTNFFGKNNPRTGNRADFNVTKDLSKSVRSFQQQRTAKFILLECFSGAILANVAYFNTLLNFGKEFLPYMGKFFLKSHNES